MISFVIAISCLSLAFAVYLARWVLQQDMGTQKMQEISNAIKEGAEAFMSRQNRTIIGLSASVGRADLSPLCLCAHAEPSRSSAAGGDGFLDHTIVCLGRGLFGDRRLCRHVGIHSLQHQDCVRGSFQSQ